MSKTVVFVINTLQGNGAERVVITLADAMIKMGHKAHIVLFKDQIELPIPNNLKIHVFGYQRYRIIPRKFRSQFVAKTLDRFILNEIGKPDLILSNLHPVDTVLKLSKLNNINMVVHNVISQQFELESATHADILRDLSATYGVNSCICVSKGVQTDLSKLYPNNTNVRTIYNPVEPDVITAAAEEFVPEYKDYIVNVGKFKHAKRHDVLLRAFARADTKLDLVFVGKGGLEDEMKALAIELGIETRVHFAGFQKNPFPIIKHAKMLAVSSDFEGLGLTILEAIVLGMPVVSTDCPSGPNEILPLHNLTPVRDLEALAIKIAECDKDPDQFKINLDQVFTPVYAAQKYLELCAE